jgi:hypothetical protein
MLVITVLLTICLPFFAGFFSWGMRRAEPRRIRIRLFSRIRKVMDSFDFASKRPFGGPWPSLLMQPSLADRFCIASWAAIAVTFVCMSLLLEYCGVEGHSVEESIANQRSASKEYWTKTIRKMIDKGESWSCKCVCMCCATVCS